MWFLRENSIVNRRNRKERNRACFVLGRVDCVEIGKKGQEGEAQGQDKGRDQDKDTADEYRTQAEIPLENKSFLS